VKKAFPMTETESRLSLFETASAAAGAAFCGVTGYIAAGTVVWAICAALHAPLAVLSGAEILAGAGFVLMTAMLLRHALKIAKTGWA
jgi:hypothetical protein